MFWPFARVHANRIVCYPPDMCVVEFGLRHVIREIRTSWIIIKKV